MRTKTNKGSEREKKDRCRDSMEAVLTNGVDCLFGGKKGILLSNIERP